MNRDPNCEWCGNPRRFHDGPRESMDHATHGTCAGFCPGSGCVYCTGESCARHGDESCECDVLDRHKMDEEEEEEAPSRVHPVDIAYEQKSASRLGRLIWVVAAVMLTGYFLHEYGIVVKAPVTVAHAALSAHEMPDLPTPWAPLLAVKRRTHAHDLCLATTTVVTYYGGGDYYAGEVHKGLDGDYRHCVDVPWDTTDPKQYFVNRNDTTFMGIEMNGPKWDDPMKAPLHYTGYVSGRIEPPSIEWRTESLSGDVEVQ